MIWLEEKGGLVIIRFMRFFKIPSLMLLRLNRELT